jgi:hypothetical protein
MPDQDQDLTPLGKLLEHARSEVLHLSAREAARRAGISPTRWSQVVTGHAWRGGVRTPIRSTMRTVVAMALAVQVDPAEALEVAGMPASPQAIEAVVSDLQARRDPPPAEEPPDTGSLVDEIERIKNLRGISPKDKIRMVRAIVDLYEQSEAQA